jgi:murein DD-endopeptidase MepM/ murein hydrolase activator NlpD
MNRWQSCVIAAVATALIAAFAYNPVSLLLFRIGEPYFRYPVAGKTVLRNDSYGDGEYGAKRSGGRAHTGIDILAPAGTSVYAAKSGIAFCGNVPTGYGKYVMIYHPDGMQTMYAHLSEQRVYSGQKVRRGDLVGLVGKTGNSANRLIEPHVHFEIREHGEPVDPRRLMR